MLVALAILQVNSERKDATYLDNFYPFITQALNDLDGRSGNYAEISARIKQRFGLAIPPGAVRSIAERMLQRKLVLLQSDQLVLNPDVEGADVGRRTRQFASQEKRFLKRFKAFATAKGLDVSEDAAREALVDFVEEHGIRLLHLHYDQRTNDGDVLIADDSDPGELTTKRHATELDVALALFIRELFSEDDSLAEHVVGWVQGMMLASSISLGETADVVRPFRDAVLFFDTRVLFRALGLSGPEWEQATVPTLELSRSANARIACFEHTLEEMQDILHAIANAMRFERRPERIQEVDQHLYAVDGIRYRDVIRISEELPELLGRLGVEVISKPSFEPYNLQGDEDVFTEQLQKLRGPEFNPKALRRDIDSAFSVYRLRDGASVLSLESCKAVFVTTSHGLYRAARDFFKPERRAVPLVMMESRLQTAVWLKHPIKMGEDIPRAQTIAHCYATLQPDASLWEVYLKKIDSFLQDSTRTEADYVYLRFSESAREALVEESLGNPDRLTQDKIADILRARDDESIEPLRVRLEALEKESVDLNERLTLSENAAYTAESVISELRNAADDKEREIERLERKIRGAERYARQSSRNQNKQKGAKVTVTQTFPSTGETPTNPSQSVKQQPQEGSNHVVEKDDESERLDRVVGLLIRDRTRRARRSSWLLALIPIGMILLAVVTVSKPDAPFLAAVPTFVKDVLVGFAVIVTLASLVWGWNIRSSIIDRAEAKARSNAEAELDGQAK